MNSIFTIKNLKDLLYNELKHIYSKDEITSFMYILLQNLFNISKIDTILNPDTLLDFTRILSVVERLKNSEPIQYILQSSPFFDLNFKVTPAVLIPRQETEELVDKIIKDIHTITGTVKILDIGTGSGAIAIALAKNLPNANLFATDISVDALSIAEENAFNNKTKIHFMLHDVIHDNINILPNDLDVIVSNPPYIPSSFAAKLHDNVTKYEPHTALFVPDEDPLIFYRKIAEIAKNNLKNNGKLYFETFEIYHPEIVEYMINLGFSNVLSINDMNNKPRFIVAENYVSLH